MAQHRPAAAGGSAACPQRTAHPRHDALIHTYTVATDHYTAALHYYSLPLPLRSGTSGARRGRRCIALPAATAVCRREREAPLPAHSPRCLAPRAPPRNLCVPHPPPATPLIHYLRTADRFEALARAAAARRSFKFNALPMSGL